MLKLKLQYFGHLTQRADLLGKTLMLGKTEDKKNRATEDKMVEWHHWLNGPEFEQALVVGDGQGSLVLMGSQRVRYNLAHQQQQPVVVLSHVQLPTTPWTAARQAPLSLKFSRQEYWSGLPFPRLGCLVGCHLLDLGIESVSLVFPVLAGRFFTTEPTGKPNMPYAWPKKKKKN